MWGISQKAKNKNGGCPPHPPTYLLLTQSQYEIWQCKYNKNLKNEKNLTLFSSCLYSRDSCRL